MACSFKTLAWQLCYKRGWVRPCGKNQLLLRPGHANVKEPPLLLQVRGAVRRLHGKNPAAKSRDKDRGKFQALGAMQRHQ